MVKRRRWPARIAGLLGTAALLGSGVAIAVMVMPSGGEEAVLPLAPAATPTPTPAAQQEPEARFTKAQRRARRAAVDEVTVEGYEVVRLADYDPESELRVLIGRADDGTRRAFFYARRRFIGYDADTPSRRLRVVRAGDRAVTLRYGLPDGDGARVRFRWDGAALTADRAIPAPELRVPLG